MPITIATNRLYTLSLGDQRLARLVNEQDINKATEMGWIDQIKDWFESGKKKSALSALHKLFHQMDAMTAGEKDQLTTLFAGVDVGQLIIFWQAVDDQGRSLLSRAMITGDIETIERFRSLLELFPLSKFSLPSLGAMLDGDKALALALKNNKPLAIRKYVALFTLAMNKIGSHYAPYTVNEFGPVLDHECMLTHGATMLYVLCNSRVIEALRLVFTEQVGVAAANEYLEILEHNNGCFLIEKFENEALKLLADYDGFSSILNVKSALNTQAIVDFIFSLLRFINRSWIKKFAHDRLLQPVDWFSQIYVFESMTAQDMHARFDTFDRYASLLLRLSLPIPNTTWHYGETATFEHFIFFVRSAFKLQRYASVSSLLKLSGRFSLDTKMLSDIANELSAIPDWEGLMVLLSSIEVLDQKVVLDKLSEGEDKRGGLWSHLVSRKKWQLIGDLLRASRPDGALGRLTDGLAEKIVTDEEALVAVVQNRLDANDLIGAIPLWNMASPAQRTRLSKVILSNAERFLQLLEVAPRRSVHGQILFELIKASPEEALDPLFQLILEEKPRAFSASFYFDHLHNEDSSESLLTIVNQLPVDEGLKKRLMGRIAKAMNQLTDLTKNRLADSALDIWMADVAYLEQPEVVKFVEFTHGLTIKVSNHGKLVATDKQLELLVDYIKKIHPQLVGSFTLENNGFFIQLMALCTNHKNLKIRKTAAELYDQYLRLEAIKPHAAYLAAGWDLADGIRSKSSAEDLETVLDPQKRATDQPLSAADPVYIFVTPKSEPPLVGHLYDAVLLSQNDLSNMFVNKDYEWPTATFAEVNATNGRRDLAEKINGNVVADAYLRFPVFAKPYAEMKQTRAFKNLFERIDLNYVAAPSGEVVHDYTESFLKALSVNNTTEPKLISEEHQTRLSKIFRKYVLVPESVENDWTLHDWTLETVPTIRTEHLQQVYALYGLATEPETDQDRVAAAQTLFCLATLFCRFSSKSVFGVDYDSPRALRFYAAALLKQAHALAPAVVDDENYRGWLNWLCGFDVPETCTDMLSRSMADFIRTKDAQFISTFAKLKPALWSL